MLNPEDSPDSAQLSSFEQLADHALARGLPNSILTLGDLVSLAFRSFRVNYKFFFRILLLPAFVGSLAFELTVFMITSWVSIAARSHLAVAPFALYMSGAFVGLVLWFVSCLVLILRCVAVVRLILGFESAFKDAYEQVWARKGGIFVAYNLSFLPWIAFFVLGGGLTLVLDRLLPHEAWWRYTLGALAFGLLGGGLTLLVVLAVFWANLFLIVIALDRAHWSEAIKRTNSLVGIRLARGGSFTSLLECVLLLIAFAGYFPFALLLCFQEMLSISLHGPGELLVKVPEFTLGVVCEVVLNAVAFAGYALYYRDLLLRLEGIDIHRRLEKAQRK